MTFEYDDKVVNLKKVDGIPLRTKLIIEYAGNLELHPLSPGLTGEGYQMRYLTTDLYSDSNRVNPTQDGTFNLPAINYFWILEKDLNERFYLQSKLTPELEKAILRDSKIDEILSDD